MIKLASLDNKKKINNKIKVAFNMIINQYLIKIFKRKEHYVILY